MHCAFCRREMAYIHGHAACVTSGCPMRGVNQAECCDGEMAGATPVPTSDIAAVPVGAVRIDGEPGAARR